MLSVVAAIPVNAEQTEMRTVPMERGDIKDALFAENLQASTVRHVDMQPKTSVDQVAELPTSRGPVEPSRSGGLILIAPGATGTPRTVQMLTCQNDVPGAKSDDPRLIVFRDKATTDKTITKESLTAGDEGDADAKLADAQSDTPAPAIDIAIAKLPAQAVTAGHALALNVERPPIKNEGTVAVVTPPSAEMAKKSVTNQKIGEGTKGSPVKAAEKTEVQAGMESRSGAGIEGQVVVTVPQGANTIADAYQGEMDEALKSGSNATDSSVAGRASGVTLAAKDSVGSKVNVAVGKAAGNDLGAVSSTQNEQAGSSKQESDLVKIAVVTGPLVNNGAEKSQQSIGMIHAVAGSAGSVLGFVPGVVSVHAVGDGATTKLQTGDRAQAATGQVVSADLDSSTGIAWASSIDGMHTTLIATPTALEVGIPNGTHGWLKVRAEMASDGVVNASLSPASSAAQEMLHREIPSLTSYLQQERVAVNAIVVHAPAGGEAGRQFGGPMAGEGSAQHGDTQRGSGQQRATGGASEHAEEALSYEGLNEVGMDGLPLSAIYPAGGSWLNVRV